MRIANIIRQHRRDFTAIYECEHCGHTREGTGYDDANFHQFVVPEMKCKGCGKQSDEGYRPLATKHPESQIV